MKEHELPDLDDRASEKLLEAYVPTEADDLSVERVWQRLLKTASASNRPRRASLPAILAPALAALVIVLGFMLARRLARPARSGTAPPATATVVSTAELRAAVGGVFFTRPAETWRPGRRHQVLAEGERVRSDASGIAVLGVPDVASVLIAPGTDVAIDRLGEGTFLRLSRGSVVARVSKRPADKPFVILTDRYAVKVVGTLFEVDQDGIGHTAVSVREGTVEVAAADGTTLRVQAGQLWRSTAPGERGAAEISDPVKALLEAALHGAPPEELQPELERMGQSPAPAIAEKAAATVAPAASAGLTAQGGSPRPGASMSRHSPIAPVAGGETQAPAAGQAARPFDAHADASLAPAPAAVGTAIRPPIGTAVRPPIGTAVLPPIGTAVLPPIVLAERGPLPRGPQASWSLPASPVASAPAAPQSAAEGAYARGLAFERRGDNAAAGSELAKAAEGDPAHADLALYALGRLFQNRLKDPRRALEAFESYRSRYPRGTLSQEVALAVLEIDVQNGYRKAALAESERFLSAHPGSERTAEVHVLRGNLLREAGDCRLALGEYAAVTTPAFAEGALIGTARCQRELGNQAAEREALRAYQARFPAGQHRDEVAKYLSDDSAKDF